MDVVVEPTEVPAPPEPTDPPLPQGNPWFEDANVIILAQTAQFRVHKAVLALHSSVFKEYFAVSPEENGSRLEVIPEYPVPVVKVESDVVGIEITLKALYHLS
jgi:hypothetical protein